VTDPSDAEVEAALRATPDSAWRELAAAADAVAAETVHATWTGGDGHMPYPLYTEAAERLRSAVGRVGAIVVFAWPDWDGLGRDARAIAEGGAADAARMLTAILRSERFGDGSIENALNDGRMVAAARRLLAWRG
jgi:hypothetical protein